MNHLKRIARRIGRILLRYSDDAVFPSLESLPDAPDLFRYYRSFLAKPALSRKPGGWEYQGRFYPDYLMVGGASLHILREARPHCRGQGIDIGAGLWPFPGATPVDVWRGPGASRSLDEFAPGSVDYVFSSHCLEHIADWQSELTRWVNIVRPAGIVFLYLPHPDCGIWNPGSPMVADGHKWQPEPAGIKAALSARGCQVIACDDGPDAMMSFFVCARKGA